MPMNRLRIGAVRIPESDQVLHCINLVIIYVRISIVRCKHNHSNEKGDDD
jgi:hypothetical protein